jgi:hypothetical protein
MCVLAMLEGLSLSLTLHRKRKRNKITRKKFIFSVAKEFIFFGMLGEFIWRTAGNAIAFFVYSLTRLPSDDNWGIQLWNSLKYLHFILINTQES